MKKAQKPAEKKMSAKPSKSKPAAPACPDTLGLKKQYMKSKPVCKVTFILPRDAAPEASNIRLIGDFNEWNPAHTPLKKSKNGDYSITLPLEAGKEYRFRFLIDDSKWENHWCADKYLPNPFGCEDSVVIT